jgi:uncharacterized membrane protein YfcA
MHVAEAEIHAAAEPHHRQGDTRRPQELMPMGSYWLLGAVVGSYLALWLISRQAMPFGMVFGTVAGHVWGSYLRRRRKG